MSVVGDTPDLSLFSLNAGKCGNNADQNNSEYGHFLCSVFTRLFFIPGGNFIPVFLTGMSSSRDEILSRQKRVNSKRHFTIDRDDFIPGRVSTPSN